MRLEYGVDLLPAFLQQGAVVQDAVAAEVPGHDVPLTTRGLVHEVPDRIPEEGHRLVVAERLDRVLVAQKIAVAEVRHGSSLQGSGCGRARAVCIYSQYFMVRRCVW